eukprot:CAMPEP_0117419216 /NCGR_PEP_ID=MMETSP0758-20121206/830_1 /TAXON_ID=63605 /ORGANISM="Percolomonas cosmopolitus, Strain AE-1 (ATCC 50343)" /LENGTH=472 /DNA_ID=CAMNT_0005200163 /DNA_START=22 /DNA_END=1440 /DNA_ORIENTATION=+
MRGMVNMMMKRNYATALYKPSVTNTAELLKNVEKRDPDQTEFLEAVKEVLETLRPVLDNDEEALGVMERLVEPERQIAFRVAWEDDNGVQRVNRGYRVQYNSAIGPYKGGIRFHPSVNLSIVKFLGFEQTFKNSLTTLPMGGGKGGSDFNPKGKSDKEIMRFCQSFFTELAKHVGPDTDVPAGDIGVGGREVGYMFGQYKRLRNEFTGVLTGKGLSFGGSLIRPEATGYGVVYYLREVVNYAGETLEGKTVLVSGSGNVAQYTLEKLLAFGAKPLTASDSSGYVYAKNGFTQEHVEALKVIKNEKGGRVSDLVEQFPEDFEYVAGDKPWKHIAAEIATPCATQNEINLEEAKALVGNGVKYVVEGANMPSTNDAQEYYIQNSVYYGPAKASNAGGVSISGVEMAQNSQRLAWTAEQVENKLSEIMTNIFNNCKDTAIEAKAVDKNGVPDLRYGANLAGFNKVKAAMVAQGLF